MASTTITTTVSATGSTSIEQVQAVWLSETEFCSLEELVSLSGLSRPEVDHLVDMGLIEPDPAMVQGEKTVFQQRWLVVARSARRIRDDFELDTNGLAVAVSLLQRLEALQGELAAARAQLLHGRPSSDVADFSDR
ncbi:chaperone modulator CbpM [Undibacterium sp.]|uniref:chaperone modulator CbpM n=1 Tax=Undibacterium sp. TaxID=1914977 RepID=UPI00374DD9F5